MTVSVWFKDGSSLVALDVLDVQIDGGMLVLRGRRRDRRFPLANVERLA